MPMAAQPYYATPDFWTALAAIAAIALSQLPPIKLWFKPRRLEVEAHSRIQIQHKIGNPNASIYISLANTGGRKIKVKSLQLTIRRDSDQQIVLPAQSFLDSPQSSSPNLLTPITLRPGDEWAHVVFFFAAFPRDTEKQIRSQTSLLRADVHHKLKAQSESTKELAEADPALVAPLLENFQRMFYWNPGEYSAELRVEADPSTASKSISYRFTLFESDAGELKAYAEEYKHGAGVFYDSENQAGLFIPLQLQ